MRLIVNKKTTKARIAAASRVVIEAIEARVLMTAFTQGNIAVLDLAAASSNTTASVLELSPSTAGQVSPVQTVSIPSTGASALRFSDSGTSSFLADTNDRTLLTFAAYNTTDTTDADLANSPTNDRAVATLDSNGNVSIQTTYTGIAANQTRAATSTDDAHWYITDKGGLYSNGETTPTFATNILDAKSFGGTVYVSSTKTAKPVNTVASPTATTVTALPGLPADTNIQDFYLVQSGNNGTTYDLLYTMDVGSIQKFALVSGSWVAEGSYTLPAATGLSMIAAANGTTGANLYYTTGTTTSATSLVKLADTAAYNAPIAITTASNVTLYTATGTDYLKGLEFVPVPAVVGVAPSVTTNPSNQNVPAGQPVTFTAAASGTPTPTVQWYQGAVGSGTAINTTTNPSAATTSLTFTTSSTATDNGTTYYAIFTNSKGSASTTAASLNDTLAAPVVTTQPTSVSTTSGSVVTFTAAASGSPLPTEGWQVSTNGGTSYSPITSGTGGYTINADGSLTFTTASNENGYLYEAVFSNSQASNVASNPATLTLGGSLISAWNFANGGALINGQTVLTPAPSTGIGSSASLGFGSVGTYSVYIGNPAAAFTLTVTDSSGSYTTSSIATGTSAASIQTTLRALHAATTGGIVVTTSPTAAAAAGVLLTGDTGATLTGSGSGTGFFVALDAQATPTGLSSSQVTGSPDDSNIVGPSLDGSGLPNFDAANINAWRLVGTNGWNSNAPIGTQGAQFLTSTAGFSSIEASFDLTITAQGESKLQVEYTTDGSTWTNVSAADLSVGSGDTGIAVANNTSSANTVMGGYFVVTAASSNTWYNNLGVNLTGISGVNNNASFGLRIVNAATGVDCVNLAGGPLNNSSGNDRLGDIQITGNNPAAPIITTNPTNQFVANGATATFTAAAAGYPVPTVQWKVSTNGGTSFVNDTTDTGNTTGTLQVVASGANSGNEYEAVFTNTVGSATTTAATLAAGPIITLQPVSQNVNAGATVTLTSTATGTPTPTVQWKISTDGGMTFSNITGATASPYTFTATESMSGDEFEAVFTNTGGIATSTAARLIVSGTPIAQWNFTGGEAPTSGGSIAQGTGNAPFATFGPLSNTAGTLGLLNDYTGVFAYPESDILVERSVLNPAFTEYDWRIRSGNGQGPTGSPGTPEGWSQNAPEYANGTALNGTAYGNSQAQGVQFDVNTTGYSNITLHFDWNQGGISDMQPLYSTNGGSTWTPLPNGLIEQAPPTGDFYGITATTPPTGILVNLQGIAGVNNNPNFELQLVSAYSPTLPLISDGNQADPAVHGQYASGGPGAVNAQQVIQFGNDLNDTGADVSGGTFTLTYNNAGTNETTAPISYSSTPATLITNITTALTALTGLAGNFTVSQTNYSLGNLLQPVRDALGNTVSDMTVTFNGALAATAVNTMTVNGAALTGGSPAVSVATWVNGSAMGFSPYVDGSGAWQLGNFSFNGDSTKTGGLSITAQPVSTTAITSTVVNPATASFTASAYSEFTPTTAQWQVSINGGTSWNNVTTGNTNTTNTGPNYTSTYTISTDMTTDQSGNEYRVIFTASSSTTTSNAATLTVVLPQAPAITLQPTPTSVQAGNPAVFNATANGSPGPTVQWQISADGGTSWTNISNVAMGTSGATSNTLNYLTNVNASENGDLIRAVFTNEAGSINSNAVVMTVLANELAISDWDFANSAVATNFSPPPTSGVVDTGSALPVGMTLAYNPNDSATGIDGFGTVPNDDITNTPSAINTTFNENTWRVRGGDPNGGVAGTPANGWSNFAPALTQGAQFSVPTTGFKDIYATLDWYSTTSGILDGQLQYTTGGTTVNVTAASLTSNVATITANNSFNANDSVAIAGLAAPFTGSFIILSANSTSFTFTDNAADVAETSVTGTATDAQWINYGPQIQAVSNDFYGATATTAPIPLVVDVSQIPAAANNPNFGIRLMSAYDPMLSNTQTLKFGATTNFTLTFGGQTTGTITYTSVGNTLAASIQSALSGLSNVGAGNVTVTPTSTGYTVTFGGTLNAAVQPAISISNPSDTDIYTPQYANAALTSNGPAPYNGSKGNWRFDRIAFHGEAITATSLTDNGPNAATTAQAISFTANVTPTLTPTVPNVPTGEMVSLEDASNGNAVVATGMLNASGVASITVPAGTLSVGTHNLFAVYGTDGNYVASQSSPTISQVVTGVTAVTPTLVSSQVGDNSPQRSTVSSISVTFNEAVNFSASSFSLFKQAQNANGSINLGGTPTDVSGGITATSVDGITWTLSVTPGGSLDRTAATTQAGFFSNGIFQLVLHGAHITDAATGTANYNSSADQIVSLNSVEAGGTSNYFHILYGDLNGDGKVNATDYFTFSRDYLSVSPASNYNAAFDYNGDGKINATDYFQFSRNYLLSYSY